MKRSTLYVVFLGTIAIETMSLWRPSRNDVRATSATSRQVPAAAAHSTSGSAAVEPEVDAPIPPELADLNELDSFLARLERDALAQGALPDEDVGMGYAAIESLAPKIGAPAAFARTRRFTTEVRNLKKRIELAPVQTELGALAERIRATDDAAERPALIAQYRAKASAMPEIYRLGALDRLREASGAAQTPQLTALAR